jgi:hypothetical protein
MFIQDHYEVAQSRKSHKNIIQKFMAHKDAFSSITYDYHNLCLKGEAASKKVNLTPNIPSTILSKQVP